MAKQLLRATQSTGLRLTLLLIVLFEGLVTVLAPHRGWPLNLIAFGVLGSGLAVGAILWACGWKAATGSSGAAAVLYPRRTAALCIGMLLPAGWWVLHDAIPLLRSTPVSAAASDVIPTVQIMVRRALAGAYPYTTITDFGYPLAATYLPMQWMPYTPAEVLGFDYRYTAFALFGLGAAWTAARTAWRSRLLAGLLVGGLLLILFHLIARTDPGILTMTIEAGVASFYLLLIAGIGGRSAVLCGVAIALCLLSRYSLVLWLPLWAAVEWTGADHRRAWKATGIAALLVLVLYVLPFLSQDWSILWKGYKYYDISALGEWQRAGDGGRPYQLYHGFGAARLVYETHAHEPVADRLHRLQKLHVAACLGIVASMAVLWRTYARHRIDRRLFLLGSFKVYLTVFLFFIQVPYPYLMIVGTAVSVALLGESFRRGTLTFTLHTKASARALKPRIFQGRHLS